MASIVSTGIGSGLDITGIVQGLVQAEGQPVESRIIQQEARAQAKLSAFGSLKAVLADFRDKLEIMKTPEKFLSRKAVSSNEEFFTVSAGTSALPAKYSLEVVQLAEAQKLTSGAFADSDAVVGTGTLSIAVGGSSMDLEITAENQTLAGVRDAINSSSDNPGVAATIVNAEAGSYLVLTSENTGAANSITVTQTGGDGGLSALEYDPVNGLTSLTESIAGQDALVRIDGFDVVSDNNTISGAVDGVTISLLETSDGAVESLTVENDESAARQLVEDFVESYNEVIRTLDALTAFDAENEIAAPLIGDATIRGIRDQIRRELSSAVSDIDAPFSTLGEVGIAVQLDGSLEIDDEALSNVLADEFFKFGQLFSNTDGFATRLFDLSDGFLKSDGIIETRTRGLEVQMEALAEDKESLDDRLSALETRLLRQFNALDSLLAQLSSTSNFLTQQLNNLPSVDRPSTG
ncbi:MAG: flagellar filament capping protein FliD [Pseudomonadota bacterium]